jgi:hypothetical protein
MSRSALKTIQAAAGGASDPVYVDDVFSTYVYTGVYSNTDIVNGIDLAGEGGLVWTKRRNSTRSHDLSDTERGVTKSLYSSNSDAQGTDSQGLLAFNSNGYRIGGSSSYNNTNDDYVSWTFRKAKKFFDIVTYTGNGTAGHAVSHNLGSVPGMILIKNLTSESWLVYHRGIGNTKSLTLNTTAAEDTSIAYFNNTDPTSTHFTLGTVGSGGVNNENGVSYIAYLFAHDAQDFGTDSDEAIIKCGSYTGNGSSTGPTIDLGFEPQWLLIKKATGSAEAWVMHDNMRGIVTGGNDPQLQADSSSAEWSGSTNIDLTATGFKLTSSSAQYNQSSQTYIYMAIRRPHKPASEFAATDLFTPVLGLNASANGKVFATTYPVDLSIGKQKDGSASWYTFDRMRGGGNYLFTNSTGAESSTAYQDQFDHMDGLYTTNGYNYTSWIGYQFRRAPGFFDVVAYTGNQTARQIAHNLGVVPEMMWVKCRSQTRDWAVYAASQGNTKVAPLDLNAFSADTSSWNNTSPTSTHFTVGDGATTNFNPEPMIAYLFASVPGISKVGSYTATGSNINVDCGFTNGARFVLIKWASDVSDWYVWDSVRGIVAGTDPYIRLNKENAQTTTSDWIDPLSSGFTVTNAAGNDMNNSGGTYIFYAIA